MKKGEINDQKKRVRGRKNQSFQGIGFRTKKTRKQRRAISKKKNQERE